VPPAPATPMPQPAAGPSYFVRHETGQVYGPYDEPSIRAWITEGRILPETELSTDGRTWTPGARFPGLLVPVTSRVPAPRAVADTDPGDPRAERPSWRKSHRRV
jgi:hypothetical protein